MSASLDPAFGEFETAQAANSVCSLSPEGRGMWIGQTLKQLRDSAAQKESIASGKSSVHGNSDWVWRFDPIGERDREPIVPVAYAAIPAPHGKSARVS